MASPIRKDYCTMAEAAESIGVTHSQVSRYVSNGLLSCEKIGRQIFLRWSDVRNFHRPSPGNPQFRQQTRKTG